VYYTHLSGTLHKQSKLFLVTLEEPELYCDNLLKFLKRNTVNIYRYKTIETNENTGVIPTTYQPIPRIASASMSNLPQNGNFLIEAEGIDGIG
jgi:hypothetical protein